MKNMILISVILITNLAHFGVEAQVGANSKLSRPTVRRTYAFNNGQWFNGRGFDQKTVYSVNGVFTFKRPRQIDSEVDLGNKFVVPPFAEAHNHNLASARGLDAQINLYLRDGVFYSKNLHYVRELTAPVFDRVNVPTSVDVAYAHGGLLASGGHAAALYEMLVERGVFPGWTKQDLDGKAFFIIDNESDLESKWGSILAGKPDFIKTYLEFSEEYEKRKSDPKYFGKRGLNPRLLPLIVQKAHRAGLRVSTHIETATDFHHALIAGVDEIAHLPGYQIQDDTAVSTFQISENDARLAAKMRIFIVTTTVLSKSFHENDPKKLRLVQDNQIRNLQLLRRHGVKLAFGSDTLNVTSLAEVMNLYDYKIFDNLALLKIWCESTPQTIFPKRKLGQIKEGYEASFLVLSGNPLDNFEQVKNITLRVKQGRMINLGEKNK